MNRFLILFFILAGIGNEALEENRQTRTKGSSLNKVNLHLYAFDLLIVLEVTFVFCNLQYTIAMMGYADEYETTVLELTYNYGVTEYTKGNAYAQVA